MQMNLKEISQISLIVQKLELGKNIFKFIGKEFQGV